MPEPVLKDTIEVEHEGATYSFAIPSIKDEIKGGLRARDLRRELEREFKKDGEIVDGTPTDDMFTERLVALVVQFEMHLKRSSERWVYSEGPAGEPVIDYTKWPSDKLYHLMAVGDKFRNELHRFRTGRVVDGGSPGREALAGQPNPQNQPVRPGTVEPQ